ncbi:YwmB family TATA-box binding protein [Paenibacillus endoradicis]|uniref:YwmB family TATA-box binding protein n=1 Tax=Paenibacillus endoradicis TaxID=2972487 RepID=UPI00215901EC|nr:YwmB family TATA-box binding protein [Paenibacillus endoradicis]MCR8657777.1 YwmB family TATA-box binding protein [Paenibacillus endoradicis]
MMVYMMTPKAKPQKQSRWKLILTVSIVVVLMLFAWMQEKSTAQEANLQSELSDLSLLWKWSDELLLDGATEGDWYLRWDTTLSQASFQLLTEQFFKDTKGSPLPKNIRHNGATIDGIGSFKGSHLQLSSIEQINDSNPTIILLKIEQGSIDRFASMKTYVKQLNGLIVAEDPQAQLSMKVFGQAKNDQSLKTLQNLSISKIVEQYEDSGTKSSTLFTNSVQTSRWVNNGKMANLQLSEHHSSIDNKVTITLAIPLISGEFGEIMVGNTTN